MSKILIDEAAVKLALEALAEWKEVFPDNWDAFDEQAITALREALAGQPAPVQHTHASTQATMCAGCGEHKHTPLRIDAMGGYVCLTCIDQKLGSLLGEFGYPEPEQPAPQQTMYLESGGPGYGPAPTQKLIVGYVNKPEQPAQQEYTSFAEWANDYVRANMHKLKPAQQEPVAWLHEWEDGERIPLMYRRDDRKDDKPKSVRPLVYGDTTPQPAPVQQEPVPWSQALEDVWAEPDDTIPQPATEDFSVAQLAAQQEPVTEAQIVAGARVLNRRMADMCNIDAEDQWKQYGEDFRADARAVLEAAHNIKEKNK